MRSDHIDWESGKVIFWDMEFLDLLKPLTEQLSNLKEDLVQVKYGDRVLDVGWYPEFSNEGEFVIRVVHGTNWDEPLFQESCRTTDGFWRCLKTAIKVAQGLSVPEVS